LGDVDGSEQIHEHPVVGLLVEFLVDLVGVVIFIHHLLDCFTYLYHELVLVKGLSFHEDYDHLDEASNVSVV
jgi:hypothetical protein